MINKDEQNVKNRLNKTIKLYGNSNLHENVFYIIKCLRRSYFLWKFLNIIYSLTTQTSNVDVLAWGKDASSIYVKKGLQIQLEFNNNE